MSVRSAASLIIAGVLLVGGGYGLRLATTKTTPGGPSAATDAKEFPLLAKRLFVEEPNDTTVNFADLRKQLRAYVADNGIKGSIYFEYLPTGTSVRIDGDQEEIGASLIKLPAAMDLYRAAQLDRISLDKQVTLQPEWLDDRYGTLYKKGAGYTLTLREAAKIMLEQSDNTALNAIAYATFGLLNSEEWAFAALDVDITQTPDMTVAISARSYGSILKCLYFSCYLTHADSQELLGYLTHTPYTTRLVAGITDPSITVAHKIGVASTINQSDCGIVYLDKRNYLLCMMLNGQDSPDLDKHFAALSRMVYDFVSK